MRYPSRNLLILFFIVLLCTTIGIRINAALKINEILPLKGLYVDEMTYSTSPFPPGSRVFGKPPAMFALTHLFKAGENPACLRLFIALLSLLPAGMLLLAFKDIRKNLWLLICVTGLLIEPFNSFFGLQIVPAIPAALFLMGSLMVQSRFKSTLFSGILAGIAVLFRGEIILVLPFLLLLTVFRSVYRRKALVWCGGVVLIITPVIVFNAVGGGGAVIASNGAENLWLGTDWNLLSIPPGVEFEELISVSSESGHDAEFLERARESISAQPFGWLLMGLHKIGAFFSIPGPGRNMETGWLLQIAGLSILLPATLFWLAIGLIRSFDRKNDTFAGTLASAIVFAGISAAFIFFPSTRSRTAFLPAFFFLGALYPPDVKELRFIFPAVAIIILLSVFHNYPAEVRPGLTYVLSAEQALKTGNFDTCLDRLALAEDRGFEGADVHNIRGAVLSERGELYTGMLEFELALEIAEHSPTVWRNYSVSLWNLRLYPEARIAALHAVELNPVLTDQLAPILAFETPVR